MMGRRRRETRKIKSDINVTPLVDVMLVLLIIFMITSPMMISGISIDLPEVKATPIKLKKDPLLLSINKKGQLFIEDNMLNLSELKSKLKAVVEESNDTSVQLRADKDIKYQFIAEILNMIKEIGVKNIALITKLK